MAEYDHIERRWLMDTGCPYDLVCESSLQEQDHENFDFDSPQILLQTANGPMPCAKTVPQQIGPLGEQADPYVLKSTPDVLTIGYRCEALGYGFHWDPYSSTPYLVTPEGEWIPLASEQYVPYLYDYDICPRTGSAPSAPATVAGPPAPSCIRQTVRPAAPGRRPAAPPETTTDGADDDSDCLCDLVETSESDTAGADNYTPESDSDDESDVSFLGLWDRHCVDGNHSHAAPAVAGDDEEVDSDADDEAEAGEPDAAADEGGESDDDSHDLTT
ncbi:MAG: hypothetical protein GY701_11840, partial [Sulfitobacter sp.]|nr:hypothetical protein [Sulfitobacter sp.]